MMGERGIVLRAARENDADGLAALHGSCFEKAWSAKDMAAYASDPAHSTLAAFWGDRLIGMIVCRMAGGDAEILTLAVAQDARRQGVARDLLLEGKRRLSGEGIGRIVLEVNRANDAALSLYRGFGFQEIGQRPQYYAAEHEDALLLALDGIA